MPLAGTPISHAGAFVLKLLGVIATLVTVYALFDQVVSARREFQMSLAETTLRTIEQQRALLTERSKQEAAARLDIERFARLRHDDELRIAAQRAIEAQARATAANDEARAQQIADDRERRRAEDEAAKETLASDQRAFEAADALERQSQAEMYEAVLDVADSNGNGSRALIRLWSGIERTTFDTDVVEPAILTRLLNARSSSEIELCFAILISAKGERHALPALVRVNRGCRLELQNLIEQWLWALRPAKTRPLRWYSDQIGKASVLLTASAPNLDPYFATAFLAKLEQDGRMPVQGLSAVDVDFVALTARISIISDVLTRSVGYIQSGLKYQMTVPMSGLPDGVSPLSFAKEPLVHDFSYTYLPGIEWPAGRLVGDFSRAYVTDNDFSAVEIAPETYRSLGNAVSLNVAVGDRIQTKKIRFVSALDSISVRPKGLLQVAAGE